MKAIIVLSLFCFLPSLLLASEEKKTIYLGTAHSQSTNKIVYYELHEEKYKKGQPAQFTTTYISPSKKIFAVSTNNFHTLIPSYQFKDTRFGYQLKITPLSNTRFKLTKRVSWNEPAKKTTLMIHEKPIINDSLFPFFISNHWQPMKHKQAWPFIHISAKNLNYYSLKLIQTKQTKTKVYFQIEPSNILYRWLTPPLKLEYAKNSKHLLTFTGVSNIPKNINRNYRVHTYFNYNNKNQLFLSLYKIVNKKNYSTSPTIT